MGFEFEKNAEGFSVFNFTCAIAVFIFEIIEAYIYTYPAYVLYSILIGGIGMVSCASAYFFDFKNSETAEPDSFIIKKSNDKYYSSKVK